MNASRRAALRKLSGLQDTARGEAIQTAAYALDGAAESAMSAIDQITEAIE